MAAVAVFGLGSVALGVERLTPFGARSEGERKARIEASPLFEKGKAQNLIETSLGMNRHFFGVMGRYFRGGQEPDVALPVLQPVFAETPSTALTATWLGHSSIVLELDGVRLLTDPVLSERASPFSKMGPARFHPAPVPAAGLPDVDAVLISHDHYDHLDMETMAALAVRPIQFIVPLGVGAHLEAWGVPPEKIVELEWWQETEVKGVRVVCTPARHFSGRGLTDRNRTLWASWAVVGAEQRAWFSGDTGPFPQASDIGDKLGPFDLTMIEIGAYDIAWGSVHLGPDEAHAMHRALRGSVMFPIHWGTFNLAAHRWDQPIVRMIELAGDSTALMVPVAGETQDAHQPSVHGFWRERAQLWSAEGRTTLE
jgi:L-ascorbate metabolism protein UlaG (beta-lactamase superfamily)